MMVKYFVLVFINLFFLLFATPAWAVENWVIDNFQSQINIQTDGKVQVTEAIDVDFGTLAKHGIYRDIPYIYPNEQGIKIYTHLQIQGVFQDGLPAQSQVSKESDFFRIKIGDPNKTISFKHSYQIKYLATGVLKSFTDYDELYWDITGNGWPVRITQASATVTLPQNGLIKIACFEGTFGSKILCRSNLLSPTQATFYSTRSLKVGEGLTAVAGFTKGLVPILIVTPPSTPDSSSSGNPINLPNFWLSLATFLLGVGVVLGVWWKKGKEQNPGTIMVEYLPPAKLKPAEVGVLLDERADTLDVSATIIDFATKGFLTIKEEPKKWLFGSVDYILSETSQDKSNLLPYENELLKRIFAEGEEIKISELKTEFYDDLAEVKQRLYEDMVDKKFFPANPEQVKNSYALLGGVILLLGIGGAFLGLFDFSGIIGGVGWGMIGVGISLMILFKSFSKRTTKGYEVFKQILGFRMFVGKAEKYKQQFLERENIFNEVLPYAIVFGVTEKFAQAFADLGLKPTVPTWYYSSRPFDPLLFSSSINSFSGSLNSAISSQPARNSFASSGSGFSSGGGFSGGGSGGGGGGSW